MSVHILKKANCSIVVNLVYLDQRLIRAIGMIFHLKKRLTAVLQSAFFICINQRLTVGMITNTLQKVDCSIVVSLFLFESTFGRVSRHEY